MGGSSKILMLLSIPLPRLPSSATALRLSRHRSRLPIRRLSSSSPLFQPRLLATRAQLRNETNAKEPSSSVDTSSPGSVSRAPPEPHPWPEWSALLDHVASAGYSNRPLHDADLDFAAAAEGASEEFSRAAVECLAFARDRPDLIRSLSRKNIEVVVEHGSAFLFKNGENSERLMRSFLSGEGSNVFESEKAQTVDVMRYVLSYAYNSLSTSENRLTGKELVDASARSLLAELINVSVLDSKLKDSVTPTPIRHEQFTTPSGQNIEMKRGDWICPKCTFMNFAKNMRCLECDEVRPKRQLTGAEWECPQCDFFNYGKNVSCLRCDCKRPGESPSSTVDRILSGSNIDKSELEQRLSANDEKAERWLSKVSQVGDSSDISNAVADEDFPEIMPLRKGTNKFVVSNRKTPQERRLANSQSGISSGIESDKPSESSISKSLDRILGRTSTPAAGDGNTGATSRFNSSGYRESIAKGDPNYVPFVPLPPDMFRKPQNSSNETEQKEESVPTGGLSDSMPTSTESCSTDGKKEGESSDASERVFNKASELDNVTDLANATQDDDFPEIMPMRKGENRFVVSKKKDRSLTSPQYKRRLAMEQANSSNFVPFVPFPPDYFAKKDKKPEGTPVPDKEATAETSAPAEKVPVMSEIVKENTSQQPESRTYNENYNIQSSGKDINEAKVDNSTKGSWGTGISKMGGFSSGASADGVSAQQQAENPQKSKENADRGFSGKSLEGSAVKEPDPLDMSEEAKAERWFRRVAQIKDISELSQIPDEDFPEIMPMRKGVNRFVVSKRKTPLERRLTSPQYRRNLPIVSSDPEKDDS